MENISTNQRYLLYSLFQAKSPVYLSTGAFGDIVLNFAFLSSGVMAASLLAPLVCALLFPGRIDRRWVLVSVFTGAILAILFGFWDVLPIDSTSAGIWGASSAARWARFRKEKASSEDVKAIRRNPVV